MSDRAVIAAEVRRALDTWPRPERGPRGFPGADGRDADPDEIRAEIQRIVATIPRARNGKDGAPGRDGADGVSPEPLPPRLPKHAEFERDPDTHLTRRVVVSFAPPVLSRIQIVPVHDADGFITAADFSEVTA